MAKRAKSKSRSFYIEALKSHGAKGRLSKMKKAELEKSRKFRSAVHFPAPALLVGTLSQNPCHLGFIWAHLAILAVCIGVAALIW